MSSRINTKSKSNKMDSKELYRSGARIAQRWSGAAYVTDPEAYDLFLIGLLTGWIEYVDYCPKCKKRNVSWDETQNSYLCADCQHEFYEPHLEVDIGLPLTEFSLVSMTTGGLIELLRNRADTNLLFEIVAKGLTQPQHKPLRIPQHEHWKKTREENKDPLETPLAKKAMAIIDGEKHRLESEEEVESVI